MLPGTVPYSGEVEAKSTWGAKTLGFGIDEWDGMVRAKPEQFCFQLSLPKARKQTGDLSGHHTVLKKAKGSSVSEESGKRTRVCSRGSRVGKRDLWVIWSWTQLVNSAALGEH